MAYRIKELREARGWTQSELADRCGTTQQAIQRYETGAREPRTGVVTEMSAVFGVTISYLLGLDDDPAPHGLRLTPEEQELLDCYRASDSIGKADILAIARIRRGSDQIRSARSA